MAEIIEPNETPVADTEVVEPAPEQPAEKQAIPPERFDEVIAEKNSLKDQAASLQQQLYDQTLLIQRLQADQEAAKRYQTQAPAQHQPLTPEEAQRQEARDTFTKLVQSSVSPILEQQLAALRAQFAPLTEVVEETKRTKFWNESRNQELPEDLKGKAENAYMQFKDKIPGLDRAMALQFVKGEYWDKQNMAMRNQTEANKKAQAQVNGIARQTMTGPGTPAKPPKADSEKTAADLAAELMTSASRNYR